MPAAAKANTYFPEIHCGHSGTQQAISDAFTWQKISCKLEWIFITTSLPTASQLALAPPLKPELHAVTRASHTTHMPSKGHLQQIQWCLPGIPVENIMVLYRHTGTKIVPKECTAPFPFSVFWYMENNNLYIKQNKGHRLGKEIINKVGVILLHFPQ